MKPFQPGLRRLVTGALVGGTVALTAVASAAASPISAQTGGDVDVVPGATWTVVGIAIGCVAGGVLYLFKRQVGAFPKDPEWVAPISIMRSEDLPEEGDFGPGPASPH